MATALLALLRRHGGQWLSTEALSAALGRDVPTIHAQTALLMREGYGIESHPVYGYRLTGAVDRLNADVIELDLGTRRIGRRILVYDETDSTNDAAWRHADAKDYDGLAVFAEKQRQGRGRLGRAWSAAAGSSLTVSILLQGEAAVGAQALTLMAGVATLQAAATVVGARARLKWPNDVLINGRKAAGVMVEARYAQVAPVRPRALSSAAYDYVIGIGINCHQSLFDWPSDLRNMATSLDASAGGRCDRVALAQHLLRGLDNWLQRLETGAEDELHRAWSAACDDIGRRITLQRNGEVFSGRVVDVCCRRGLLLQGDGGGVRFFDGMTTSVVK